MHSKLDDLYNILNKDVKDIVTIINGILKKVGLSNINLGTKSFSFKINNNILELELPKHWQYVDMGRKPGSYPPLEVIYKWVLDKKITNAEDSKRISYAIQRSIFKKGIKPKPFLDLIREEILKYIENKITTYFNSQI